MVVAGAQRDQAVVVETPAAEVGLVGTAPIARQAPRAAQAHDDTVARGELIDVLERPEDQRLGAEVEQRLVAVPHREVAEHERLARFAQLGGGEEGGEHADVLDAGVGRQQELERLGRRPILRGRIHDDG